MSERNSPRDRARSSAAARADGAAAPPRASDVAGRAASALPEALPSPTGPDDLDAEQSAVLRQHGVEELGQMVALAHHDFDVASERARPAAEHRYRMLLDLWLKQHPAVSPERAVQLLQREEQYMRELWAEESRVFHLPLSEAERQTQLEAFKRRFWQARSSRD